MSTLDAIIMAGSALDAADTLSREVNKILQAYRANDAVGSWPDVRMLYAAATDYDILRERQIRIAEASLAE